MTRRKTEINLPPPVPEDGYPDGDGPAWISEALGVAGCVAGVTRYLSDDGEATSLVLRFANGREQLFRPARLVLTRRLPETLGALGFPVPYYQPPQLAALGQAIGRVADRNRDQAEEDSRSELTSVVAVWLIDCLVSRSSYVLRGRAGVNVRAALEHVRTARAEPGVAVPVIVEPARSVLLAWTPPVRTLLRDRLGPMSDGTIGMQLRRSGVKHEVLAARPGPGQRGTQEIPVFVVPNGWQGVKVEMPGKDRGCGALKLTPNGTGVGEVRVDGI
jgi:hypothetical protein